MTFVNVPITSSPSGYDIRLCDDPIEEIWSDLLLFANATILKKCSSDPKLNDDLVKYVVTALRQAREYYVASKSTSIYTKPLLLFYCINNLTRAVLTVKNDSAVNKAHGLSLFKSKDNIWKINAKITKKGTFRQLAEACDSDWDPDACSPFTLADAVSMCIELAPDCGNYFEIVPSINAIEIERMSEGTITFKINEPIRKEYPKIAKVLSKKKGFADAFEIAEDDESGIQYKNKVNIPRGAKKMREIGNPLIREHFLFSLTPRDPGVGFLELLETKSMMPQECCYYLMSFLLSNAVRYAPDSIYKWLHDPDMPVDWVIQRICNRLARVYPNYMLNMLLGEKLRFTTGSVI